MLVSDLNRKEKRSFSVRIKTDTPYSTVLPSFRGSSLRRKRRSSIRWERMPRKGECEAGSNQTPPHLPSYGRSMGPLLIRDSPEVCVVGEGRHRRGKCGEVVPPYPSLHTRQPAARILVLGFMFPHAGVEPPNPSPNFLNCIT